MCPLYEDDLYLAVNNMYILSNKRVKVQRHRKIE